MQKHINYKAQIYADKCENLLKMDAFVRKYNLLNFTWEDAEKKNPWKGIKTIKFPSKALVQTVSQLIFSNLKKWIISVLSTWFQKLEKRVCQVLFVDIRTLIWPSVLASVFQGFGGRDFTRRVLVCSANWRH